MLANKQDLPHAASAAEVIEKLGLVKLKGPRAWHVQGCCAVKKEGIQQGFQWLVEELKRKR